MNKVYAAAAIIAVLSASAYGFVAYGRSLERADNAERVADLQSSINQLGLVIQKQESEAADSTRKLSEAEQVRVNAIRTTDHQADRIKALEVQLRGIIREQRQNDEQNTDIGPVRIILTASTERVWEQARGSGGLPASTSTSLLQKRLSAVTADDINGLIKYAVGAYNQCALKYNELWPACDRLINESQKKPGD